MQGGHTAVGARHARAYEVENLDPTPVEQQDKQGEQIFFLNCVTKLMRIRLVHVSYQNGKKKLVN
jgi:hypothetical protein